MTLTPEQQEFRAVVRQFAEDKLAPLAAETDRTAEYSWPAFEALRSMELTGLSYPEEYGGAGADLVTQAIVAEELARVDASASLIFLISKLAMLPVLNFASDELKARYLPRIVSGESQGSYCLSEADAGSDVASMTMRAVRDGDDYVLSGTKVWITNGGISDLYTVFAKTDPAGRAPWHQRLRRREGLGRADRQARAQAGDQGLTDRAGRARRGAGAGREPHRRGGSRASSTPCTRWTAAVRRSARRRSASRKAPSTTPWGT